MRLSGYVLFDGKRRVYSVPDAMQNNIFCLHRERHSAVIERLGLV